MHLKGAFKVLRLMLLFIGLLGRHEMCNTGTTSPDLQKLLNAFASSNMCLIPAGSPWQILVLTSAFCAFMACYETLEYAFCYDEEKKEYENQCRLNREAQRLASSSRRTTSYGGADENRSLLRGDSVEEFELENMPTNPADVAAVIEDDAAVASCSMQSDPNRETRMLNGHQYFSVGTEDFIDSGSRLTPVTSDTTPNNSTQQAQQR